MARISRIEERRPLVRVDCSTGIIFAMTIPYHGEHIQQSMVTTALELPGHRIVRNLGLVRGIVVRSRSIFGTVGAAFQSLVGGNVTLWSTMCEQARRDSYE